MHLAVTDHYNLSSIFFVHVPPARWIGERVIETSLDIIVRFLLRENSTYTRESWRQKALNVDYEKRQEEVSDTRVSNVHVWQHQGMKSST